jgi:predicted regulator of Ras-like GTPase activity (Roadblock/LC7/MglB family)
MKSSELPGLVTALRTPIREFVRDARVRVALLVTGSGQVLAQHGFTRAYEVMNVASLAAAAHASSRMLSEVTRSGRWTHMYHAGRQRQLFLAPLTTPAGEMILVVVHDSESSLGLVQVFFERLCGEVAELGRAETGSADQASFETDLNAGLERVFPESAED